MKNIKNTKKYWKYRLGEGGLGKLPSLLDLPDPWSESKLRTMLRQTAFLYHYTEVFTTTLLREVQNRFAMLFVFIC